MPSCVCLAPPKHIRDDHGEHHPPSKSERDNVVLLRTTDHYIQCGRPARTLHNWIIKLIF